MEALVFALVSAAAVITAFAVLVHRNPVIQALFLVGNLVCLAILYLLLGAQFLGAIQIIVYAGAVMVLIIFVIMLLNLRREGAGIRAGGIQKVLGAGAALAFLGLAAKGVLALASVRPRMAPRGFGTVEWVGRHLFEDYFYPFEAISIVLLVAMAGAVVLAKRKL